MGFSDDLSQSFRQRYALAELLGEGACGAVFRAVQTDLKRDVAIKFLKVDDDCPPSVFERFHREAQILAALEHPLVLKIFDYGQDGRAPFIVTPFVKGRNLRAHMRGKVFGVPEAIRVATQVLDALEYIHGKNILHRDLKPENILVAHDNSILLADFGVAHIPTDGNRLTREGTVMGTPRYLAPELLTSPSYTAASDIYAVGTLVFELVTGRPPFAATSVSEAIRLKLTQGAPGIRRIVPTLPEDLEVVIARAIDRQPENRYMSARAMRDALATCLRRYCSASVGAANAFSDASIDTLMAIVVGPGAVDLPTIPGMSAARRPGPPAAVAGGSGGRISVPGRPAVQTPVSAAILAAAATLLAIAGSMTWMHIRPVASETPPASAVTPPAGTPARDVPVVVGDLQVALETFKPIEQLLRVGRQWRQESTRSQSSDPEGLAAWVAGQRRLLVNMAQAEGLIDAAAHFRKAVAIDPWFRAPIGTASLTLCLALNDLRDLHVLFRSIGRSSTMALRRRSGNGTGVSSSPAVPEGGLDPSLEGLMPPAWQETDVTGLERPKAFTIRGVEKSGDPDPVPDVPTLEQTIVVGWCPPKFYSAFYDLYGDLFGKHAQAAGAPSPASMPSANQGASHTDYACREAIALPSRERIAGLELAVSAKERDPRAYFVIRLGNDTAGWRDVAATARKSCASDSPTFLPIDPALLPDAPVRIGVHLRDVPETDSSFHCTLHWLSIRWTERP